MTEPLAISFTDDGAIPNSTLPLLVYRAAVPADPAAIERLFATNQWPPAWRDGVHPFHHFHSTAHEALGVARGEASVLFGGPGGSLIYDAASQTSTRRSNRPSGRCHCPKPIQSKAPTVLCPVYGRAGQRHPGNKIHYMITIVFG
jgi:uncharacterized protein YjlB